MSSNPICVTVSEEIFVENLPTTLFSDCRTDPLITEIVIIPTNNGTITFNISYTASAINANAKITLPANTNDSLIAESSSGVTLRIMGHNAIMYVEGPTGQSNTLLVVSSFNSNLSSFKVVIIGSPGNCTHVPANVFLGDANRMFSDARVECGVTAVIQRQTAGSSFVNYTFNFMRTQFEMINVLLSVPPPFPPPPIDVFPTNLNPIIVNDMFVVRFELSAFRFAFASAYSVDRMNSTVIFVNNLSTSMIGQPLPLPPGEGHDFCAEPIIIITNLQLSNTTGDVLEIDYDVLDGVCHEEIKGPYEECTSCITNGTKFTIFLPFISCVVIGEGTLLQKIPRDELRMEIVFYAMLKLILARLVFDKLSIEWLLRCNYEKFIKGVSKSRYRNFLPVLEQLAFLEVYFRCDLCR